MVIYIAQASIPKKGSYFFNFQETTYYHNMYHYSKVAQCVPILGLSGMYLFIFKQHLFSSLQLQGNAFLHNESDLFKY